MSQSIQNSKDTFVGAILTRKKLATRQENELFHEKISIPSKKADFVKDFGLLKKYEK